MYFIIQSQFVNFGSFWKSKAQNHQKLVEVEVLCCSVFSEVSEDGMRVKESIDGSDM